MIRISQETRENAAACPKYHLCLNGDEDFFCSGTLTPDGLYIKKHSLFNTTVCPYHITDSAGNDFCRCPVRIELREKHGI